MSALDGLLTLNTSVHTLMFHNVMEDYTTEEEMAKKTQKVFYFLKGLTKCDGIVEQNNIFYIII